MRGKLIFYFDFFYACDAPTEVSQKWYQSQAKAARRRGSQPLCKVGHPRPGRGQGQGQLARATACDQGQPVREADIARRDSSPQGRPTPLTGEAARRGGAYGHDRLQPAWHPQGAVARNQPCRQQGRRRWPQGSLPLGRVAAGGQGQPPPVQGQQRQRRIWGKRG
ncbi:hypothetical protein BHM03_00052207 [Ensete ventricosum]|nr:hypothetical protein BHM03_00052207 [Ensete ventricosum]